ncbi:MAG: hypothetical protein LBQ22_02405 [Bacteroidales bacterium]|jgi:hypothetical protein|nr:hypothetical protein [Bacteroidales bacterium]
MFNYNFNQNNANPKSNNFCGGYALAAIFNTIHNMQLNMPNPQNVYNNIQNNQVGVGINSQNLIQNTQINNTDISLPSSIAIAALQNNLIPIVIHGNTPFLQAVILEEINRIQAQAINIVQNNMNLNQVLLAQNENYFIVLVNMGQHWIAIEKLKNNIFNIYDPGTGLITNNLAAINYSGIIIAMH